MEFAARVWKDPVWSKVISAAVIAAVAAIWAQLQGYLTFAALQHGMAAVWDFLTGDYYTHRWHIYASNVAFAAIGAWLMRTHMQRKIETRRGRLATMSPGSAVAAQAQTPYLSDELFGFR